MIKASQREPNQASFREVVAAGDYFIHTVKQGQTVRLLDLEGNQAADTLFYSAADPAERYSAMDTIREQGNVYLTAGTTLMSNRVKPLLEIVCRHLWPPRHPRRRLCDGKQYRALRSGKALHACLSR